MANPLDRVRRDFPSDTCVVDAWPKGKTKRRFEKGWEWEEGKCKGIDYIDQQRKAAAESY